MNAKNYRFAIVLAIAGVVFLVPALVMQAINGELLRFSPGVAVGLGWLLGAGLQVVLKRKSVGRADPPSA